MGDEREKAAPPDPRVGSTLNGKWRIERLLDVGGMGAVYVAVHRNGRRAAIKMLHPKFGNMAEIRRRFQREGYVANKIDHPGAVAILDDDVTEDGAPYLVLELLDGESLAHWLSRVGSLPAQDVVAIAGQVLEVLAVAHDAAIVHRDIKPANIFVTKGGFAKLLDFGLARIRDGNLSLHPTADGIVMGTAGYMSPEQARAKTAGVDVRTDIFSVGAVMFRALTGRRIHERPTALDMTMAAVKEPAPPLLSILPGASAGLAAAVDKALAFDKAGRWATAREMFEALRAIHQELRNDHPRPPGTRTRLQSAVTIDVSIDLESSLVADVAFGTQHDEALARERERVREVAMGLTTYTEPEAER
jgi:serine/threonine protein kinase